MPSLTELQAFLSEADRGRYELNALRLATTASSRHQLGIAIAELNQVKTHPERQWTLFYLLRIAGTMEEAANLYKGLLGYLYEGDHWIDGLGVDQYLEDIEYERHLADRRKSLNLPSNWVALAKNRLRARWAAKAEELAARQIVPAIPKVKSEDKANVKKRTKPAQTGEEPSKRRSLPDTSDLAPVSKTIEQEGGEQPLASEKRKKKSKRSKEEQEGKEEPAVPLTLWDVIVDDEYRKLIDTAESGHNVLPPNLDDFPTETGLHDWPEGDTLHWFDIVQQACANIKLLTLPLSYPDLVKQAGRRKPKKAQQKYTPEEVEQWERVVKEWDAAMVDLPQIRGNAIIRTNDGEIVLYKLDNALTAGWEDPEIGAKFIAHLTDSLETLREKWNGSLPLPGKSDTRHHAVEEMRAKYGADNVGVWHFAFWIAQGQPHRGPVISSQCHGLKNVWRFEPANRFLEAMAPWQQAAAMLFRLLEPESCKRYKDNFETLCGKYTTLQTIRKTPRTTFLGLAIPFQVRVLPHKDNSDDQEGWVAMTNLGDFFGGDLIVGSDRTAFRLEYRPGQFVLMKSALLRHAITPFEGKRRGLVLFSHEDVFDYGTGKKTATA